jgi:hypothetical protein
MNFDEPIYCLSEPDGAYVSYFPFLAISSVSARPVTPGRLGRTAPTRIREPR